MLFGSGDGFARQDVDMWGSDAPLGPDGWPVYAQLANKVWDDQGNASQYRGWYTVTFQGQAEFQIFTDRPGTELWANGTLYPGSIPKGVGFNSTTGLTTLRVNLPNGAGIANFMFLNAQRNDTSVGLGEVKIMRPTAPGSSTSYGTNEIFTDGIRDAMRRFTTIRWLTANGDPATTWAERRRGFQSYETMIRLSNETGKDLWITLPVRADNAYVTNMANALRFGLDAAGNPYTTPQTNPVVPPLNPNLRVYMEVANEIWNNRGDFPQTNWAYDLARTAIQANNTTGQQVNFDGTLGAVGGNSGDNRPNYTETHRRWTGVRTVQVSNLFRSAYGDAAMGSRLRMVLMGWYNNTLDATRQSYDAIDANFPQPASYYIWGGGDATYYGSSDKNGENSGVTIANGGFESGNLTGWTVTGTVNNRANGDPFLFQTATTYGSRQVSLEGFGSSISQTVTVPVAGNYALLWKMAGRAPSSTSDTGNLSSNIRVRINGVEQALLSPGKFGKRLGDYSFEPWLQAGPANFGTQVVNLPAGTHTIEFTSVAPDGVTDPTGRAVFLDEIKFCSAEAIVAGIPEGGEATGQPVQGSFNEAARAQTRWPLAMGLNPIAYEGGLSVGGDFNKTPLTDFVTFGLPALATKQLQVDEIVSRAGYQTHALGTYETWPTMRTWETGVFPLPQGIDQGNRRLPIEADNGLLLPASLGGANSSIQTRATNSTLSPRGWVSWNVVAPVSGNYVFSLPTSGSGTAVLEVSGSRVGTAAAGTTVAGTVYLEKGIHGVRVLNSSTSGTLGYSIVGVDMPGAPSPAVLNSATAASGTLSLSWSSAAGATGYRVIYGNSSGLYSTTTDVGNVTNANVSIDPTKVYYVAIQAYNSGGAVLARASNELRVAQASSLPAATVNFQQFTTDTDTVAEPLAVSGYEFRSGSGDQLSIRGNSPFWSPSAAIWAESWGGVVTLRRADGAAFDLNSLDVSGDGLSVTLTVTDISGGGFSQTFQKPNDRGTYVPLTLNVSGVASVSFRFWELADGSGGGRFGALDNIRLNQVVAPTLPAAPTGLGATAASATAVSLAWTDNSNNESGFKIERATNSAFTAGLTSVATTAAAATTYTDITALGGTTYFYRVRATNAAGDSANSNTATVTTPSAPNAPTGLSATAASATTVNLAWTDNSSNETGFKVERATNSTFTTGLASLTTTAANAASYTDTSAVAGTTYFYRVRSTNTQGDSANSNTATVTTPSAPSAPTGLSATATSQTSVNLTWTDNSNNETGFKVERATNSTFTTGLTSVVTTAAGVVTYTESTAAAGTTYFYRVRATNAVGDSANSNTATVTTPSAPTLGVFTSASDIGGPSPAGSTGFNTTTSTYTVVGGGADIWGGSDQFHFANLDRTGDFVLTARIATQQNTNGWAKSGVMIRESLGAGSVHAMVVVTPSNGVAFQWRSTTGANSNNVNVAATGPLFVRLTRQGNTITAAYSSNGTSWTPLGTPQTITLPSTVKAGLAVTSHANGTGNTTTFTDVAFATVTPSTPTTPSGLTASAPFPTRVVLNWTDNSTNETGFKVERATNSSFSTGLVLLTTTTSGVTTYTDNTTVGSTAYFYRVRATNASGDSANSNSATVTTPAAAATLAQDTFGSTPRALHGTATGTGWASAWSVQNASTSSYTVATTPALTYSNLNVGTGLSRGGGSYLSAGRTLNTTGFTGYTRDAQNNIVGQSASGSGIIYLSVLLRNDSNTADDIFVGVANDGTDWIVNGGVALQIGQFGGVRQWGDQELNRCRLPLFSLRDSGHNVSACRQGRLVEQSRLVVRQSDATQRLRTHHR